MMLCQSSSISFFYSWDGELGPFNTQKKTEWYYETASTQPHQPSAYSQFHTHIHFSPQVLLWNILKSQVWAFLILSPWCVNQVFTKGGKKCPWLAWVSWDHSVLASTGIRMEWQSINLDVVLSSWRTLIHLSSNNVYEYLLHARLHRATRKSMKMN